METERSKRNTRRVGETDSKKKALDEIWRLREEGGKRTDQYHAEPEEESVDEEGPQEYNDDFIADGEKYEDSDEGERYVR